MTKRDPNRTACEEDFMSAVYLASIAGACRIVSRRPTTDLNARMTLVDLACEKSAEANRLLSALLDPPSSRGGTYEVL